MYKILEVYMLALASVAAVGLTLGGTVASAASDWDDNYSAVERTSVQEGGTLADQFFHLEWTAEARPAGQSTITGYVYNDYGQPAHDVQLQIIGVDTNGRAVESVIQPVRGVVPGEGRAYFEVRVPDTPAYRASVAAFDFLEFPGK